MGDATQTAYRDEAGVRPASPVETYVALTARINNWRWAGVPFFLRTGKRLSRRLAEIVVTFRDVPTSIFDTPVAERYDGALGLLGLQAWQLSPEAGHA